MSTNKQVIESFLNMEQSNSSNLSARGSSLFSYNLEIARWVGNRVIVFDYTKGGDYFQSMTTSQHVGLIKREIDLNNVMPVPFATKIGLIRQ